MTIILSLLSRLKLLSLRRRLKLCAAIATLVCCAMPHMAAAADKPVTLAPPPCPDISVDVYLSRLERVSGTPPLVFSKLGPPQAHLRLPSGRLDLRGEPDAVISTTDCSQTSFNASAATYHSTSWLAGRLGITYAGSKMQDGLIEFNALDPTATSPVWTPAPVDDTNDREGTARQGAWIVEPPTMPYVYANFCLSPPALADQCYAGVGYGTSYKTGHVYIDARGFQHASLTAFAGREALLITMADLDHDFAFLRRTADAVVVAPSIPTK